MEQLIKPAEYAANLGISRQAVYAKIKKGILSSRNIGGKIFIVLDNDAAQKPVEKAAANPVPHAHNQEKLLAAKDETISILKETISDLKETNKMITSTLRGEVELLKDAFGEMKMLYGLQLEHKRQAVEEEAEEETEIIGTEAMEAEETVPETVPEAPEADWLALSDFYAMHNIKKKKQQKKIAKYLKKRLRKGDSRLERHNGEIIFLAGVDYKDILKKA